MILVADFDAPLALEADFTGGAALSELGREASKPCISACVPVSTLTDAESSGANCPSEASRQACAPVSAVTMENRNLQFWKKHWNQTIQAQNILFVVTR